MNYEKTKEYLDLYYIFVEGKEKDYYCDENNKVIATINNEIITLYINDPLDELETQYQVIALPIVNNELQTIVRTKIVKLIGEYNDVTIENGISTLYYNDELDIISSRINKSKDSQRNLGNVGSIKNHKISLKQKTKKIIPTKIKKPNNIIKQSKGLKQNYC